MHFKGRRPSEMSLSAQRKENHLSAEWVIYRSKGGRVECEYTYVGESGKKFGQRFREHLKVPSPVYDHYNTTAHTTSVENISIMGRKEGKLARLIKEAILIRANDPSLNRNINKYHLAYI